MANSLLEARPVREDWDPIEALPALEALIQDGAMIGKRDAYLRPWNRQYLAGRQ